ncbi:MAG: o-succinylbenzoate--CoA ligase, partial [Candidatus Omnitrophica bacterium]|nr:o-succinylbenzoate--CoA ligase [Candidatus Omnitrophota bacterium]
IARDRSLSYQQLEESITLAVENLKRLDVVPRERVALNSPNTVEYIVALFALWRQRAVACLLSPRLPEGGARACLQNISCARTIAPEEISIPGTRTNEKVRVPGYAINDAADIMFTSGSSGEPKAAVHTLASHYFNALGANERIPVIPGDRWLLSLPLYHVGGLGIVWRTFLAGGTVVVPDLSADLADSLRKFNVTHVSLVPTQLHRLLSDPKNVGVLQKMKAVLIGGGPVPGALILRAIDAGLPVYVTYGLTETASQVATSNRLTKENPSPEARPLRYSEVCVSPDNEILVRGKTLFAGYWRNGRVDPCVDQEGWFATGDLGRLNADGSLTVLGRKDNMFISGGENIQPEEIERHLCRIDGVVQAVVVPVASDEFGARPVAFVQTKDGTRISGVEILSFLRSYLPSFKLPVHLCAWPATAPTGLKPDRAYFLRLIKDLSSLKAI